MFETKNVDEDEQAYTELIAKGYRTIPVTSVGDQVIKGFDEAALRAAIRPAPPTERP